MRIIIKSIIIIFIIVLTPVVMAQTRPSYLQIKDLPAVDVRQYGAKADGVADDSPAFEAAIKATNYRAKIELENKTYYLGVGNLPNPQIIAGRKHLIEVATDSQIIINGNGATLLVDPNAWTVVDFAGQRFMGAVFGSGFDQLFTGSFVVRDLTIIYEDYTGSEVPIFGEFVRLHLDTRGNIPADEVDITGYFRAENVIAQNLSGWNCFLITGLKRSEYINNKFYDFNVYTSATPTDYSVIFDGCLDTLVEGNTFESSRLVRGTAIELHSKKAMVRNNNIDNFENGVLTFYDYWKPTRYIISKNQNTNAYRFIFDMNDNNCFASADFCEVSNNIVSFADIATQTFFWMTYQTMPANWPTRGIELRITGNDVFASRSQSSLPANNEDAPVIQPVNYENLVLSRNTFKNMPQSVLHIRQSRTNKAIITNNEFIDSPWRVLDTAPAYSRSATYIFVDTNPSGVAGHIITGNIFTKDNADIGTNTISLYLYSSVDNPNVTLDYIGNVAKNIRPLIFGPSPEKIKDGSLLVQHKYTPNIFVSGALASPPFYLTNGVGLAKMAPGSEVIAPDGVLTRKISDDLIFQQGFSIATPTPSLEASWYKGNIVWNASASPTSPLGWVCTTNGTNASWTPFFP